MKSNELKTKLKQQEKELKILRQKVKQLEVLSSVSQTIVSNRYLKEILQLIVTMTAQVMNSKICSIMLLDEKKTGIVSMLSIPMMLKERAIGVINSYTSRKHKFSDGEIKILQAVANQAAVAIDNTNLNQEILAAKEALEKRKMVEKAKGILMKEPDISENDAHIFIGGEKWKRKTYLR